MNNKEPVTEEPSLCYNKYLGELPFIEDTDNP